MYFKMRMLRVTALHLFIIVLFLVLFDVCYCLCSRVVLGVMFVGLSCESITPLAVTNFNKYSGSYNGLCRGSRLDKTTLGGDCGTYSMPFKKKLEFHSNVGYHSSWTS